jgi:protein-L-isoaspartate O-methyltransferase
MIRKQKEPLIYPPHIRLINLIIKKYVNTYWTIIDLLSNKFSIFSTYLYQNTIKDEYNKEHALLQLTQSDKVLHIGCGVFPYSAILLSKKKNDNIIAIDNNTKAIDYAQQMIQNRKLEKTIQVKTGEGTTIDLSPYSVIISSSCVDSSEKVLQNIINTAKPGTRIIIRELRPMSHYLKKIIKKQENITLEHHLSNYTFPFYSILGWDSFILKKK